LLREAIVVYAVLDGWVGASWEGVRIAVSGSARRVIVLFCEGGDVLYDV
jgi:hypothetical protein